jgi:eukaryotic-like serine/threonine-protein kinase
VGLHVRSRQLRSPSQPLEGKAVSHVADPLTGRVLDDRYEIGRRIARGGMASVYEANDLRLARQVAVKVMHDDLGDDAVFAARFVREARAAAKISHPNVVAVTDQGDDHGRLFIVMEHVRGTTLRDQIREHAPMSPARALALLEQVLLALAAAHAQGIVHRDVKPENVLISTTGEVKVADFGLARALGADTQHTRTGGAVIGTVSYLAPEVIEHGRADARTDVYSAGVVLFEMLTGSKPHAGDSAIQVAWKHVHEDIPAPSGCTEQHVPDYVDALVQAATSRIADQRPADAKVMLMQTRRARAAVEAGVLDDPELAADFRPSRRPAYTEPADEADEADEVDGVGTLHFPAVAPDAGSDETTVIRPAAGQQVGRAPVAVAAPPAAGFPTQATRGTPPEQQRHPPASGPSGRAAGPAPRRGRDRRGPLLLVVVVLLVALVSAAGWWLGMGRYTSTPGVINLSRADAQAKLSASGLEMEVVGRDFSETVTRGSVIATDPKAGSRVVSGDTVEVVLSRGAERYAVPRLGGRPVEEVEGLLTARNLALGDVRQVWHASVPAGLVVGADPAAGTELRRDTVVDVTVSKGPEPIRIPDLTGRKGARAEQRLERLGFGVEVTEEHSDDVADGLVISQDPAAGTGYADDVITLVVSTGPVMVEVPPVSTQPIEEATEQLEELGFEVRTERTDLYIGWERVVRQNPKAGSSAPRGSTITLFVV